MSKQYKRGWWDGFLGRKTYGQGHRKGKKAAAGCGQLLLVLIVLALFMKGCS